MASNVMDQDFFAIPSRALVFSLVLHISIPFVFITLHSLDKWGLFPFLHHSEPSKQVYQNFIQVDVVALPDALPNEEKKAVDMSLPIMPKPGGTPEIPTPVHSNDGMTVPDEAATAAANLAKRKHLDAQEAADKAHKEKLRKAEEDKILKHLKEEADREAALKSIVAKGKQKGRQQVAGNLLSKGASISGMIGTSKDQYGALVTQAIHEHFNPYMWLQKRKLFAVVRMDLFPTTGRVRAKKILKSSGDSSYDSAVLQAIDESQPLPIPADSSILEDGITIEFRPEKP